MRPLADAANQVRQARRPAAPDNIFLAWQSDVSRRIVESLDAWRDARDSLQEQIFLGVYGLPFVQALVGEGTSNEPPRQQHPKEPMHRAMVERQIAELKARMVQGGLREAAIRAMLYIAMADGSADERAFAVLRQIRAEHGGGLTLAEFKALVREQFFMLLVDEDAAMIAISEIARRSPDRISDVVGALRRVATARGPLAGDRAHRLARVERLFAEATTALLTDSPAFPPATGSSQRNGRTKDARGARERRHS